MSVRPSSVRAQRVPNSSARLRNLSQVYVLVPRSPYSPVPSESIGARKTEGCYNPPTRLRTHNMSITASPLSTIKRNRSEGDFDETELRVPEIKPKRPKVSTMTSKAKGATRPTQTAPSNANPEFPNGFFYCHQCNKKRDSSGERRPALIMRSVNILKTFPSRTILYL